KLRAPPRPRGRGGGGVPPRAALLAAARHRHGGRPGGAAPTPRGSALARIEDAGRARQTAARRSPVPLLRRLRRAWVVSAPAVLGHCLRSSPAKTSPRS